MSDNNTASGGVFGTVWLIATIIDWLRPADIPQWVISICDIIFWIGVIGWIIVIIIAIIVVAAKLMD